MPVSGLVIDATGRVLSHRTAQDMEHALAALADGQHFVEGSSNAYYHYVVRDGEAWRIAERASAPLSASTAYLVADGIDVAELTLPASGSFLMIGDREVGPLPDQVFCFTATEPQSYQIQLGRQHTSAIITIHAAPLDQLKALAKAAVDGAAGAKRSAIASPVQFQDHVYAKKEAEARACSANNNPIASDYPFLQSYAAAHSVSLHAAATAIIAAADATSAGFLKIEIEREALGARISAAKSGADIHAIITSL